MKAFILMPFDESFESIYSLFISKELEKAGFDFERADDLKNQQNILKDIIIGISSSDIIIADLSNHNPNVYYELGIAHALNKPVILLTNDISDLPFDLKSYRAIEYDTHFEKMNEVKEEFANLLEKAKKGDISFSNPVSDFLVDSDYQSESTLNVISDQADLGFFDHLADIEESFKDLQKLALEITESTEKIASNSNQATNNIRRASDNTQASAIRIKKISQSLADDFEEYSGSFKKVNPRYKKINTKIKGSLDYVFTYIDQYEEEQNTEMLLNHKENFSKLEDSLNYTKDQLLDFQDVLKSLSQRNLQKDLSHSLNKTVSHQDNFINNIEQTISTSGRTIMLIERILNRD